MSRLSRCFHVVVRRRGRLAVAVLAGPLLAVAAGRLLPRVYEAGARVAVRPAAVSVLAASERNAELVGGVPSSLRLLRKEIKSPGFLSGILDRRSALRLGLTRHGEEGEVLERLRRGIRVEPRGEGRFEIACRNSDATVAREVANGITADLVQRVSVGRRLQFERALQPLEQESRRLQESLREKKEQIAAFRVRNRDFLVSEETVERQIAEQEAALRVLAGKMEVESHQLEILQAKLAETPKTIETERSTEPDPKYRLLQSELGVLKLERDRLLLRYTEKHPSVEAVSGQIEEREHQLAVLEEAPRENVVESINPLYQLLQQRRTERELAVEQIRAQSDSGLKVLAELQQRNSVQSRVQQEYSSLTQEYSALQQEQENTGERIRSLQEERAEADAEEPVQVLAWAQLPARPLGPGLALLLPAGLGVGVLLGLAVVFLAEGLDRSVRTVEQARRALNLPVLGAIPVFGIKEE